jgi:predicted N-acyltransferase
MRSTVVVLPAPLGAEDPEDLVLLHGEGDIVGRYVGPVAPVQVLHLDHCWHAPVLPVPDFLG